MSTYTKELLISSVGKVAAAYMEGYCWLCQLMQLPQHPIDLPLYIQLQVPNLQHTQWLELPPYLLISSACQAMVRRLTRFIARLSRSSHDAPSNAS